MVLTIQVFSGVTALAQNANTPGTAQSPTVNPPAPLLGYAASQVLQLAQAKLGDDAILAYIKHSGNRYRLNADQIIYLRQQGISDPVITAMLNQPAGGVPVALPTTPAPQPMDSTGYPEPVAAATPYDQTVPDAGYYPPPDYGDQPYCYYPAYYPAYVSYPAVTFYYGWGGGGRRVWPGGGYSGGGHRGGGYRVASSVGGGYRGGGVVAGGYRGGSYRGSSGGGRVGGGQVSGGHSGGHVGGHR